jgi:HK97 family phage prohead protease
MTILTEAAEARSIGARDVTARPSQRRHAMDPDASSAPRVARRFDVRDAGTKEPKVGGFASVTGIPYEMYDMYGPYTELVSSDAFDITIAKSPLVEFTLNHGAGGGIPMAHTRNGTLELSIVKGTDENGLYYLASVDTTRTDVADAVKAMDRGDLAESSFKFRIVRGQWSPDWTEYHIEEIDIERGDVSAVNFGANPFTSVGLRNSHSPILAPATIVDADIARRVLISDADTRRRVLV